MSFNYIKVIFVFWCLVNLTLQIKKKNGFALVEADLGIPAYFGISSYASTFTTSAAGSTWKSKWSLCHKQANSFLATAQAGRRRRKYVSLTHPRIAWSYSRSAYFGVSFVFRLLWNQHYGHSVCLKVQFACFLKVLLQFFAISLLSFFLQFGDWGCEQCVKSISR